MSFHRVRQNQSTSSELYSVNMAWHGMTWHKTWQSGTSGPEEESILLDTKVYGVWCMVHGPWPRLALACSRERQLHHAKTPSMGRSLCCHLGPLIPAAMVERRWSCRERRAIDYVNNRRSFVETSFAWPGNYLTPSACNGCVWQIAAIHRLPLWDNIKFPSGRLLGDQTSMSVARAAIQSREACVTVMAWSSLLEAVDRIPGNLFNQPSSTTLERRLRMACLSRRVQEL